MLGIASADTVSLQIGATYGGLLLLPATCYLLREYGVQAPIYVVAPSS